jgi:two-component system cell cycle response regulator
VLKGDNALEPSLYDCPGTVEACGAPDDRPLPREEPEDTVSVLRAVLPIARRLVIDEESVFERRERRDTPVSIVLLAPPQRDRATLTILTGVDPGSVLALEDAETILGRSKLATLPIDEPSISRKHARITRSEDGRHVLEDLGSKNGTFVNGRAVTRVVLRSGDRVQLGPQILLRFALVDEREEMLQRRLHESSTRDALTGLANRRCLLDRLEREIARGRADESDTGVLMIDVDHFKQINDAFGHLAGDQVLRALAMSAGRMLRAGDLLARYGGEEFVAVICGTMKDDLVALAERIRLSFGGVRVEVGGGSVAITVSIGVALWSECPSANCLDLVALADGRMYSAKLAGRDRVCSGDGASAARREEAARRSESDLRTLRPPPLVDVVDAERR